MSARCLFYGQVLLLVLWLAGPASAQTTVDQLLQQAQQALDNQQPQQALDLLAKVHPAKGSSQATTALELVGLVQLAQGQFAEAEATLSQVWKLRKKNEKADPMAFAQSSSNLAEAYLQMGQFDQAEPLVLDALQAQRPQVNNQPLTYAATLLRLARIAHTDGRYTEAAQHLSDVQAAISKTSGPAQAPTLYVQTCLWQGRVELALANWDKARASWQAGLAFDRKTFSQGNSSQMLSQAWLAHLALREGNAAEAAQGHNTVLAWFDKNPQNGNADYMTCLELAAVCAIERGQYTESEPLLTRVLVLREQLGQKATHLYAASQAQLGLLHYYLGHYAQAQKLLTQALDQQVAIVGKGNVATAHTLVGLAMLNLAQGRYDLVETYLEAALSIQGSALGKDHPDYAHTLALLAYTEVWQGYFDVAAPLFSEALQIQKLQLGERHPEVAVTQGYLAYMFQLQARFRRAEGLYLSSIQTVSNTLGAQHPQLIGLLTHLAELYEEQGQTAKADPLYNEALNLSQNSYGRYHPDYARSVCGVARFLTQQGKYSRAEQLFLEALPIKEKTLGKEHDDYAATLDQLAGLYKLQGQYAKAAQLFAQSMQLRRQTLGKSHPALAANLINLAQVYEDQTYYDKAESLYLEAARLTEQHQGKAHASYALALTYLAHLNEVQGNTETAEPVYLEALGIRLAALGESHPDYAASLLQLRDFYKHNTVKRLHYDSLAFRSMRAHILQNGFAAEASVERLVTDKAAYLQLGAYFAQKQTDGHQASAAPLAYTQILLLKGLLLEASTQLRHAIQQSADTSLVRLYTAWVNNSATHARQSASGLASRHYLDSLDQYIQRQEQQLRARSSGFSRFEKLVNVEWQDVQKNLQPYEAAIEFITFPWYAGGRLTDTLRYGALVLRPGMAAPLLVLLNPATQVDQAFPTGVPREQAANVLYNTTSAKANTPALYPQIWQPLEAHLKGVRKLYVAPVGRLNLVNLAALPVTDSTGKATGKMLMDQYQLTLVNSTRSLTYRNQWETSTPAKATLLALGGINYERAARRVDAPRLPPPPDALSPFPDRGAAPVIAMRGDDLYRDGFSYLPGTLSEVLQISQASFGKRARILSDTLATEAAFKRLAPGNSIIHISTHGFFLQEADEVQARAQKRVPLTLTGLALAGCNKVWNRTKRVTVQDILSHSAVDDGILSSEEVSALSLQGTQVVVLSACETGLGRLRGNEGVMGLPRAFRLAGAKAVIMTLWKIPDAETVDFMTDFYDQWLTSGDLDLAFAHAQRLMRARFPQAPYKWAAFTLVR